MNAVTHTTDCLELTLRPFTEPLFQATDPIRVSLLGSPCWGQPEGFSTLRQNDGPVACLGNNAIIACQQALATLSLT